MSEERDLLVKAANLLRGRWFIQTDEDEYNDDEVIALSEEIDAYLERTAPSANESPPK